VKTAKTLLLVLAIGIQQHASAQGRVVINEYLPWPLNGCGVTSEFVELLNFGPGPINIGCYILTDGDYAITIPPNTILQPGQFYVIAGQDVVPQPCDNVDSTIHAHLNWNTCNCTSAPIPTTGDGFLTDGGSSNEQLVLFDPNLNVVDAVVRKLPQEPSSLITTSSVGGGCTSRVFDLDLMNIEYETIGESDGRGNSMARKTDGDCGWVKDSRQSANATNNTPGEVSSLDATLNITSFRACPPTLGSILIVINSGDMSQIFPMRYTLAFDSDNNNIFNFNDTYTTGVDSTPNTIPISGLTAGRYRIVIETRMGCNLTAFDFVILPCSIVLNTQFVYSSVQQGAQGHTLNWQVSDNEGIDAFELESSRDGGSFTRTQQVQATIVSGTAWYSHNVTGNYPFWRIKMTRKEGGVSYSPVLSLTKESGAPPRLLGNPVQQGRLRIQYYSPQQAVLQVRLLDVHGKPALQQSLTLQPGDQQLQLATGHLPKGLYFLTLQDAENQPKTAPVKVFIERTGG
jgi:hypothetical protein